MDSNVPARLMDRLHDQANIENEERDWERTGRIPCSDCGTMVRTENATPWRTDP